MTLYERFEKISEADMTKSTRRRLLSRAGKACVGLAVAAAGLARVGTATARRRLLCPRVSDRVPPLHGPRL
jgi:hypothetical protein